MAPRKRGGGGGGRGGGLSFIFCCFNGSDHPEITYRLREDFALQAMEPALPMPGYDELDGMFSELVVSRSTHHTSRQVVAIADEKSLGRQHDRRRILKSERCSETILLRRESPLLLLPVAAVSAASVWEPLV